MKKMITVMILCIVSAGASAQGLAGGGGGGENRMERTEQVLSQLQTRFANANTTRDGKLTREQARAGMPMVARHFDEMDTHHVGYLTLPQIEAFMAQRMRSR